MNAFELLFGVLSQKQHRDYFRRDPVSAVERSKISPGQEVHIVQKHDQRSGNLTRGVVKDILTKSPTHPHGIKVRLETGEVGRVREIIARGRSNVL